RGAARHPASQAPARTAHQHADGRAHRRTRRRLTRTARPRTAPSSTSAGRRLHRCTILPYAPVRCGYGSVVHPVWIVVVTRQLSGKAAKPVVSVVPPGLGGTAGGTTCPSDT